jgi:lysozyme
MNVSPAGRVLIEGFEGVVLSAYQDLTGVWTIGYGHTGNDVYPGLVWTQEYADYVLSVDLGTIEMCLNNVVIMLPSQNQFDAFASLTYNIGQAGFVASSALRQHNVGNFESAAADFLLWDKAHVRGLLTTVRGLLLRRSKEMALYLTT